jgi:anti-anti-sigma factor
VTPVTPHHDIQADLQPTSISVNVEHPEPGQVRVSVGGEVDLATADQLGAALEQALSGNRPAGIEVDLSGVSLLDSTGVRTLLMAHAAAEAAGCRFIVTNPQPRVHRILAITAVLDRLGLPPDI